MDKMSTEELNTIMLKMGKKKIENMEDSNECVKSSPNL